MSVSINGVWSERSNAEELGLGVSRLTGHATAAIWNPSSGTFGDLFQTMFVNKLGIVDATTESEVKEIRLLISSLPEDATLLVLAHSQGGAISSTAFSLLGPSERAKIKFISAGGANYRLPDGLFDYENVVNWADLVPQAFGPGFGFLIGVEAQPHYVWFREFPVNHTGIRYLEVLRKEEDDRCRKKECGGW